MLPTEIIDKIFLYCDFKTLKATRALQSTFIQNTTKFTKLKHCVYSLNYNNARWLLHYKKQDYHEQFVRAIQVDNFKMLYFLEVIKYIPPVYITDITISYKMSQYVDEKKYNIDYVMIHEF